MCRPPRPISTSPRDCTTAGSASASSTTARPSSTSWSRCPGSGEISRIDPFDVIDTLGERGPIAAHLGAYEDRRSQRDMAALHRRRLQRRRDRAARGRHRRREVVRLPGARAALGADQPGAHDREHQHDQPPGAAGRQGPPAPRARRSPTDDYAPSFALLKGWRNYLCLLRLNQAVGSQRTLLEQDKVDELIGLSEWAATRPTAR